MTTMAGMAFGETPERVLRRVQQLEDVELPSLPSFSHEVDVESEYNESEQGDLRSGITIDPEDHELDTATPHPRRYTQSQPQATSPDESITTSGSPYPPIDHSLASSEGQGAPKTTATSTPLSRMRSRSLGRSGKTDRTRDMGNSTKVSSSRWQTPGEMSYSFSGDAISQDDLQNLGSERSVPLNDASSRMNRSSVATNSTTTPITKRLTTGHVTLERPKRRVTSNPTHLQALQDVAQELQDSPSISNASLKSTENTAHPLTTDRVPSLTRSEVSAPETSTGATTPEGPSRRIEIITPRSEGASRRIGQSVDHSGDQSNEADWRPQHDVEAGTDNVTLADLPEITVEIDDSQGATTSFRSPAKLGASVSYGQFSTPGVARDAPSGTVSPRSFIHTDDAPNASGEHDITTGAHSQAASFPFTPTPVGLNSRYENLSTPRAPLNDAERRKSHVLAVLSSSGIPARTPRPMTRGTPHPLRRVSVAPTSDSITEEGTSGSQRALSATPVGQTYLSVHDPGMQSYNDSFVSIASSADLTSDKRASHLTSKISRGNTSFPNILLPGGVSQHSPGGSLRGVSDQRANGVKIHKHLNAMNKQLLDSNADLAREAEAWRDEVERLKGLLQDADVDFDEVDVLANLPERSQSDISTNDLLRQTRFTTPADSSLGDRPNPLERSHSAPTDAEHNHSAILHEMAEKLEVLEEALAEKDDLIVELEQRVEAGGVASQPHEIDQQVIDLREQLEEAEQLRETLHADFAQKTEQHAQRFGEICTGFEEQVKGLEAELASCRSEVERLRAEKVRMEEMASASSADDREREWRKQVNGLEYDLSRARDEVKAKTEQVDNLHKQLSLSQEQHADMENQLHGTRQQLQVLETAESQSDPSGDMVAAQEQISRLETELEAARTETETLRRSAEDLQSDLDGREGQLEQLTAQLEDLEQRGAHHDDEEVQRLHDIIEEANAVLADKEGELESLRARLQTEDLRRSTGSHTVEEDQSNVPAANDSFVAAMEVRLDEAHQEIGRLKHQLAASPHRASSIEVRDARIQALEREKAALTDRLAAKEASFNAAGSQGAISPFKASPFVHKAIASLKTPKTPGPMKEYSWLQSSVGDANEPVLRAQMEYLQDELKNANDQLDNNFSRLESAGFGALALAEKLAKANERISDLEDEIRALGQRNKASLALVTAQRDEENRDHDDQLQRALGEMNEQMSDLKADLAAERIRLQRDNQRLQDLLSEINLKRQAEVDSFRSEMARMEEDAESRLAEVKRESDSLIGEVERMRQEKQSAVGQMRQLEHDLAVQLDAYDDLQARLRQSDANEELETELQAQHARIDALEVSLRESNLATDRLRLSLRQKSDSLHHAETKIDSLQRERDMIGKELIAFEEDLRTQRHESEQFGRELAKLRDGQAVSAKYEQELDQMRRDYRTARESLKHAKDQLVKAVERVSELEIWQQTHRQDESRTSQALTDQHAHFKAQTRDLAVQIRYLKAKFTRESTFRSALAAQKRYFLVMIGGMSLNEEATLRELAAMGCPVPPVHRPKRTLKHVGLAVLSLVRARRLAQQWNSEVELKANAVHSHQERRKASGKS